MSAGPMLLKLFAHALCNQVHRKAGSVGGDNRAWLAILGYARKQAAFDLQILRDDLNNPVGFRAARQVVLEIANGDALRQRRRKERGRLGLFRSFEAGANYLISLRR